MNPSFLRFARSTSTTAFLLLLLASWTVPRAAQANRSTTPAAPLATETEPVSLTVLNPELFPLPERLVPHVEFWTDVFTRYHQYESVLHDEDHPERIYAVLDFSPLDEAAISDVTKERRRRAAIRQAKAKYHDILLRLADGKSVEDKEAEARVVALFADGPEGREKYRRASEKLRTQKGLREEFAAAIGRSGRYLGDMEEIFREQGLPWQLTRLPFVESMFQLGATSKVAAGGMWQMMPATGRRWLDIGLEIDERYDPLRSAEAAAIYLKENHGILHTWPLAITAYNHGTGGMKRAVRQLGTRNLGVIVEKYKGRTFGFASKNFYAEFLAAAQAYENREHYFPGVTPHAPHDYESFTLDQYVPVRVLAEAADTDLDDLRELNPSLTTAVWRGTLLMPRGYELRVPAGRGAQFQQAYAELPEGVKSDNQTGFRYRVRRGDTLGRIASRHGTSVKALQRANKLRSAHYLKIGQMIWVPPATGSRRARPSAPRATAEATVHIVRAGDTLSGIADRYGTSVSKLKNANRLRSANRIYPGQRLSIPAG